MKSGKKWTLAGAAAVAVAVTVHFTTGNILALEEQLVRGVQVKQGKIAGHVKTTESGCSYLAFQGIPYATPPVGDLRFKNPKELKAWDGELVVTRDGAMCPQVRDTKFKLWGLLGLNGSYEDLLLLLMSIPRFLKVLLTIKESEDCLFLNVFTPVKRLPTKDLRPVLVFIHGGGFVRGSAHNAIYGPDYLVERDMVVVTFNYRLGAFGFLSTNTSDAPGNAGLKDQNLALKWVQENIENFGGDPNRVTIYGESAGSASVHFHILSPMSKGLFNAAIMSSSSALSTYVMSYDQVPHSELLARSLGASEDVIADPKARVQHIQSKDRHLVSKGFADCLRKEDARQIVTKLPFGPVVENCEDGEEGHFLCENPEVTLQEGRYNKVPMIIGQNSNEGTLIHALDSVQEVLDKINSDVTTLTPKTIYSRMNDDERYSIGRRVQEYYIQPETPNDTLPLYDLYGDIMVNHGIHVATKWHITHSTPALPVFVYHFTNDIFGFYKFIYGIRSLKGPGHADELGCVFNIHILNKNYFPNKKTLDVATTRMTELISNFVHSMNPVSEKGRSLNLLWHPATPGKMHYLDFGETFEIKTDLLKDRMQFWDSVYSEVTRDPVYN